MSENVVSSLSELRTLASQPDVAPPAPTPDAPPAPAPEASPEPEVNEAENDLPSADDVLPPQKKETPDAEKKDTKERAPDGKFASKKNDVPAPEGTPPPFKPNLKFKAGGQELSIDPELAEVIKTPEQEKKFRMLYEKAHGLDLVKQNYEQLKQHRAVDEQRIAQYEKSHQTFKAGFDMVQDLVKRGDMATLASQMGLSDEMVLQYAADRLRYLEAPPEEKARVDRQIQIANQNLELAHRNQAYERHMQAMQAQTRLQQVEQALSRPDIAQVAQEFNQNMGNPNAFREHVLATRQGLEVQHRRQISDQDAVDYVMRSLGYQLTEDTPAPAAQPQPSQNIAPVQQRKLPVLPNVQGGGSSPIAAPVKSLADLRKLRGNLSARG